MSCVGSPAYYRNSRYRYRAVRLLLAVLLPLPSEPNYSSPAARRRPVAGAGTDSGIEVKEMRKSKNNPRCSPSWIFSLFLLIAFVPASFAQSGDRAARAALWDGYQLPAGKFARFVDRRNGFSFRYPADWKQGPGRTGGTVFKRASEMVSLIVIIEEIPEGSGMAHSVPGVVERCGDEQ